MKNWCLVVLAVAVLVVLARQNAFSFDRYGSYSRSEYDPENEIVVVNRPVNLQGLTGLLFTNSAYTQRAGFVTFGLSGLAEDSSNPDYSVGQAAATITVGVTNRLEVGIKGKMIETKPAGSTSRTVGAGDSDLLLKWRFSSQGEILPALAFGLAWEFPTADTDKGLSEVKYEGVRAMVIATSENRVLDDGFVGLYLEAQAVFNDQLHKDGSSPYKDKYGIFNAGLLFPLSDDNRMQFMVEYNHVFKRDVAVLYEQDYTGITPGLRYVTDDFNITIGLQRITRDAVGTTPERTGNRMAATLSYSF